MLELQLMLGLTFLVTEHGIQKDKMLHPIAQQPFLEEIRKEKAERLNS
jgi:hypothetical protein